MGVSTDTRGEWHVEMKADPSDGDINHRKLKTTNEPLGDLA